MTTHVKDTILPNTSGTNTFTASVTSTAGHTLVLGFTAWMTGNVPVHITNITDSAGNTWVFSTATANQNPPVNGSYSTNFNQYGFTLVATCIGAAAITSITVTTSASVTSFAEGAVSEFSSLPAGAVVLNGASSGTLAASTTSYTTPTVSAPSSGAVLVVAYTSSFGTWTGVTSGYTLLSVSDTLAAYNVAATAGSISLTFTTGTATDVPSSAVVVIGAPSSVAGAAALAASGTLTAAATQTAHGAATLTASGTLTAAGAIAGAAALTASGTLTAGATQTAHGAAALTASGTLTAAGHAGSSATLTASGTLTAAATQTLHGGATLAAAGALTAAGAMTIRGAASLAAAGSVTAAGGTPASLSLVESIPGPISGLGLPPGAPPGPGGGGGTTSPGAGSGWEVKVRSYADFQTLLCVIPDPVLQGVQFTKQLDDIGSGTVTLSQDAAWWHTTTLGDGNAPEEILDFECLWQVYQDGVVRFEFLGETITEQLVDPSEQRIVTITGPGTIATLKWAMCAPQGFPNIVLKLDGIEDSFDEIDANGQGVIDTNIWNSVSPTADVYITPVAGIFNYPGGAGYSLSSLYPSGSVTVMATPGTTFFGATPYDATDTLICAQVTPLGLNSSTGDYSTASLDGSELTQFYVQSNLNPNYYAMIGLSATSFYCQMQGISGTYTKVMSAYDPTNHAYWQITEQGGSGGGSGTFYFWTSPDGQNWTLQWQIVHNWNATDCVFYFTTTYDTAGAASGQLTNLNSNVTAPSFQGALYLDYPIMAIWFDQWAKAQARGTIPFTTTSLSPLSDSFGNPWTDTQNVQTVNGTDLYSFLQSCASVLNADYVMQPGFVLQVGQPTETGISLGVQRQGQIIFREGRDAMSRQRTRQRNQIQNVIGAQNQDGHEISAIDGASVTAWGQREAWFQTGAQIDPTSMAIAAAAASADNADEITSNTLTIAPNLPGKTVFQNFDVGDWVGVEDPTFAVNADRVMAIAVQVDQDGNETHELTLQTYVQWLEQQLTFVSNQVGGAFVNAPGLTPVAPSRYGTGQVPTYFTPAQGLATLADVIGNATSAVSPAQAPLVYNPTTGSYQPAGSADPVTGSPVPMVVANGLGSVTVGVNGTTVSNAGLVTAVENGTPLPTVSTVVTSPTNTTTTINGVPRNIVGVQGDGTVTSVDMNAPPPATPDTPTVFGVAAGLAITWDGLLAAANPLFDFLHVQVHVSTFTGFTPNAITLQGTMTTGGIFNVAGLTPGTTYYVKLVAANTSGVTSPASTQASAAAGYVTSGDILSITASLLGNLGVLNLNPYFWGGDGTAWAGGSGAAFTVTSSPPTGAPYKYAGVATVPSGNASAFIGETVDPWPAVPGSQYLVTGWVYSPTGSVTVGVNWRLNGSSVSSTTFNLTVPVNTWSQVAQVVTAPSSGINEGAEVWGGNSTGSYTLYVQASVVLPQVPGSLIQAGTIEAAQIAAGAVFAGVVDGTLISGATLEGGLIYGGLISGAAIEAGVITGGLISGTTIDGGLINGPVSGLEYVLNNAGIFFYNGAPSFGNMAFSWASVNGTDVHGNPYDAGLWSYNSSGGGGVAMLSGSQAVLYLAPPGVVHNGAAPQIEGFANNAGGVSELQAISIYSGNELGGTTGNAAVQMFSEANDSSSLAQGALVISGVQIATWNAKGLMVAGGKVPGVQVDISTNHAGNTATAFDITKTWPVAAGDGVPGTTYTIKAYASVNTGQTSIQLLTIGADVNGTKIALATLGVAFNGGATNTAYGIPLELVLIVNAAGTNIPEIYLNGPLGITQAAVNALSTNSANMTGVGLLATWNPASSNTIAIYAQWQSTGGSAQNIQTIASRFYREGP